MTEYMKWFRNILVVIMLGTATITLNARPITYYQHFTMHEVTRFNEIIWFWTPDTLRGAIRSNDYFGMKFSPQFFGPVISSRDRFRELDASPRFMVEPIFNAPRLYLPPSYPNIRSRASVTIDSDDDRYMTRLIMHDGELDIFQYENGMPPDSLRHIRTVEELDQLIILIDGKAELAGELTGALTIYATDDIFLIDDIKYSNVDEWGFWDDEDDPGGMLGIVSEGDIIIKDNWANGKRDSERDSDIVINAALIALGESFTFEHQNDDWDLYQGPPDSDERGYIYHKGSIAQFRRGFVHRSNHRGTGYGKSYQFDRRLEHTGPPGFGADYFGGYDILRVPSGNFKMENVTANRLIIDAGAEITFVGNNPLRVSGNIELNGTEIDPITFYDEDQNNTITFFGEWGERPNMHFSHVNFEANITVNLSASSIDISNCTFANEVLLEGSINVDSCRFGGEVTLESFDDLSVSHSVFKGGVTIDGNTSNGNFVNNTVVGSSSEGILVRRFRSLRIVNNIIAYNNWGIVNSDRDFPTLEYNDVFENRREDYYSCDAGEGSISVEPRFVNYDDGDYNLVWNSPCVDAGDPNSPLDADGSRVDMGALAIDHELVVPDAPILPNKFSVSAFPNPFNDVVKIKISSQIRGIAKLTVYDLRGREVVRYDINLSTGSNILTLVGKDLKSTGLYILEVSQKDVAFRTKLMYLK